MSLTVRVGVDIGGTRIRAAAVDGTAGAADIHQRLTRAERPAGEIVGDMVSLIREAAPRGALEVGVGVPTTMDEAGRLRPCLNLPTFGTFPLREELEARLGCRVRLGNDAACFTLGEQARGAARGARVAIGLTLGTSVGLGIVVGGAAFHGAHGDAGEIWRSPARLLPNGPSGANLHDLLGAHAVSRHWREATGSVRDPSEIAGSAARGDREALDAFARFGADLGSVLCWLCDILDPDVAVIGGAAAASFPLFQPAAAAMLADRRCSVVASALGDGAALIGAASLVREPGEST
jgi:predicted NBD/HSP70 family sugar kinase